MTVKRTGNLTLTLTLTITVTITVTGMIERFTFCRLLFFCPLGDERNDETRTYS